MNELVTPLFVGGIVSWAVGTFGELGGAIILIALGIVALNAAWVCVWIVLTLCIALLQ